MADGRRDCGRCEMGDSRGSQMAAADGGEVMERRRAVGRRWPVGEMADGGETVKRRRGDGTRPEIADGGSSETVVDSGQREAADGGEIADRTWVVLAFTLSMGNRTVGR